MIIFCTYDYRTVDYLFALGNDTSRIDEMVSSGYKLNYICSHYRADGGWKKGISASANERPGEFLDEHAIMVNTSEFLEWHGGMRYEQETENRSSEAAEFYARSRAKKV